MNKKKIDFDSILANNPKIDMALIKESDELRRNSFGGLKTPEYTLSPALGTAKERLDNRAKIYHLGR
ncbi:hypothetical protein SPONL_278 [uncultured Candidatus Thioglobus sp.]|nr:hypothetical protein SPONL_278 [uncultured Candidatus Thioglobus sp.]